MSYHCNTHRTRRDEDALLRSGGNPRYTDLEEEEEKRRRCRVRVDERARIGKEIGREKEREGEVSSRCPPLSSGDDDCDGTVRKKRRGEGFRREVGRLVEEAARDWDGRRRTRKKKGVWRKKRRRLTSGCYLGEKKGKSN